MVLKTTLLFLCSSVIYFVPQNFERILFEKLGVLYTPISDSQSLYSKSGELLLENVFLNVQLLQKLPAGSCYSNAQGQIIEGHMVSKLKSFAHQVLGQSLIPRPSVIDVKSITDSLVPQSDFSTDDFYNIYQTDYSSIDTDAPNFSDVYSFSRKRRQLGLMASGLAGFGLSSLFS